MVGGSSTESLSLSLSLPLSSRNLVLTIGARWVGPPILSLSLSLALNGGLESLASHVLDTPETPPLLSTGQHNVHRR